MDLARSLRRLRPERFTGSLPRRRDSVLDFVERAPLDGPPLLLDTCVYIDGLENRLPSGARRLLLSRRLTHLSVVLGELSHSFGRLDPAHPATQRHLDELAGTIDEIPVRRVDENVSAGVLLEAGILAGLVFRLGGFAVGQEVAALNDATIYPHALERGYTVLTRNIRDFDAMNQIVPAGRVLFYRQV